MIKRYLYGLAAGLCLRSLGSSLSDYNGNEHELTKIKSRAIKGKIVHLFHLFFLLSFNAIKYFLDLYRSLMSTCATHRIFSIVKIFQEK